MTARLAGATLLCLVGTVIAQEPAGRRFAVVSIKRNLSSDGASTLRPEPNGVVGINVTPIRLVRAAYQVAEFQVVDAPGWFTSERYDVTARTSEPASMAEIGPMLRTLLAERFGLRIVQRRQESRVLELQLDRDRRLGLTASAQPCALVQAKDAPLVATPSRTTPACFSSTTGSLIGRGVTTEMLAQELTRRLEQFVVDRTALSGAFDLELRWAPDTGAAAPGATTDLPPLVTAVREQLALRLVPARGPVEVYVIETASRPLPD